MLTVVDEIHKDLILLIHTQLGAILRIINSNEKLITSKLGDLCKDTHLQIFDAFPWASITPTLHKVLAHTEQLIRDSNSSYGLKNISEEGSESCNKLIRRYREDLTRKISFEANISDIFIRLLSESDPILLGYRSKIVCEKCGALEHTSRAKCCRRKISDRRIETLVNSIICITNKYE